MSWRLSSDGKTVSTSTNAIVKGNLSTANTKVNGNLTVTGTIKGQIESIHVSKITGLLGDGFSLQLPDIANNLAQLEIEGIITSNPMVIITGPGYEIERVPGFRTDGTPFNQPGFSMAHPIIFDTDGSDTTMIKNFFDQYQTNPNQGRKSMALIIRSRNQTEFFRWNYLDFVPENYEPSIDGRTRFRLIPYSSSNIDLQIQAGGDPPKQGVITNPDIKVEIEGVTTLYPQVEEDEANRILTLTYLFDEELPGALLYKWVTAIIERGAVEMRALSNIKLDNGTEISRRNYYDCFPIKYEQFTGFALPEKLKSRVTLSYNKWEDV